MWAGRRSFGLEFCPTTGIAGTAGWQCLSSPALEEKAGRSREHGMQAVITRPKISTARLTSPDQIFASSALALGFP